MAAENPTPDKDEAGHKVFTIQIDRTQYDWPDEKINGAQLRLLPPDPIQPERDLFQVIPGHPDRKIKDDDTVEVHDGLRFFTAPNTSQSWRIPSWPLNFWTPSMALPHSDANYLNERGLTHQVATESGMTCVVNAPMATPERV